MSETRLSPIRENLRIDDSGEQEQQLRGGMDDNALREKCTADVTGNEIEDEVEARRRGQEIRPKLESEESGIFSLGSDPSAAPSSQLSSSQASKSTRKSKSSSMKGEIITLPSGKKVRRVKKSESKKKRAAKGTKVEQVDNKRDQEVLAAVPESISIEEKVTMHDEVNQVQQDDPNLVKDELSQMIEREEKLKRDEVGLMREKREKQQPNLQKDEVNQMMEGKEKQEHDEVSLMREEREKQPKDEASLAKDKKKHQKSGKEQQDEEKVLEKEEMQKGKEKELNQQRRDKRIEDVHDQQQEMPVSVTITVDNAAVADSIDASGFEQSGAFKDDQTYHTTDSGFKDDQTYQTTGDQTHKTTESALSGPSPIQISVDTVSKEILLSPAADARATSSHPPLTPTRKSPRTYRPPSVNGTPIESEVIEDEVEDYHSEASSERGELWRDAGAVVQAEEEAWDNEVIMDVEKLQYQRQAAHVPDKITGRPSPMETLTQHSAIRMKKAQISQSLLARTRSRADVDGLAGPSQLPSSLYKATGENNSGKGSVDHIATDYVHGSPNTPLDDALFTQPRIAKKRTKVVQLLLFGLMGIVGGFFGSIYVQSTCNFANAYVTVGQNDNAFKVHLGLWKYSPIDSVFQGYSYCYQYDYTYASRAPMASRIFGLIALLSGSFSLSVLWVYLILGITNGFFWKTAVRSLCVTGVCQLLTFSFFFDDVCSEAQCFAGPGAIISFVATTIWCILAYEMHHNAPVAALLPSLNRAIGNSTHQGLFGLELPQIKERAKKLWDAVNNLQDPDDEPSLSRFAKEANASRYERLSGSGSQRSPSASSSSRSRSSSSSRRKKKRNQTRHRSEPDEPRGGSYIPPKFSNENTIV